MFHALCYLILMQRYGNKLTKYDSMKFIFSQTHTALAGSHLCFHPSRNNLFADASGNGFCQRMAPSTALHLAYLRINPPSNRGNIGGSDWLSPAQVGFVAHDFALPRAKTYSETPRMSNAPTISNRSHLAPPNADA